MTETLMPLADPAESEEISFHGVGSPVATRNIDDALNSTGLNFTVSRHDLAILGRNHETKENGDPDHNRFQPTKILGGEGSNILNLSQDSPNTGITLPEFVAIVRDDTQQPLCVMGRGYTPLQNRECVSIVEDVLAADEEIEIIHGGNIKNCERMFLILRLPGAIQLGPTRIERSVMIGWSHTGKSALAIRFMPYVVQKGRTNQGMFIDGARDISIRHTLGGPRRLAEAKRILSRARQYYDDLGFDLGNLGNEPLLEDDLEKFLLKLWPEPNRGNFVEGNPDTLENIQNAISKPRKSRNSSKRDDAAKIYHNDPDWSGTRLGAYFSVCRFVDQDAKVKKSTKGHSAEECRLDNIWFGSGNKTKENAAKIIMSWS